LSIELKSRKLGVKFVVNHSQNPALKRLTAFVFITLLYQLALGQQKTIVSGKVTDADTGAPVPFATIAFKGTTDGNVADFEGIYEVETLLDVDSIQISYVGYKTVVKPVNAGQMQTINIQMSEDIFRLQEVVIVPGYNPAHAILEKVIENKERNNKTALQQYEYESYTRTELDVDNISDKLKDKKIMQRISNVIDSIEVIAGEDGKAILPLFISEGISKYHYQKNPEARQEDIIRTRVKGVGLSDGSLVSQLVGSSFQEYNFYSNWMNIVTKEFASPITDRWKVFYEYDLQDSMYIDDSFCYQIDFRPKQEQDLAFTGSMWITKEEYALKRIDVEVNKKANVNFLEKIKIQQALQKTSDGPWLPVKTRVVIDVSQLTPNTAGIIGKFYVSNKDIVINKPRDKSFYFNPLTIRPDARKDDDKFWHKTRHDTLSGTEESVFVMIDSVNNIPQVRFLADLITFASTGYYKVGKIDIGPYSTFVGRNNIEGWRVGFGARTNFKFSKKWVFGGYWGYGFDDEEWKYNAYTYLILDRVRWTTIKYEHQKDIEQVWSLNRDVPINSLFYSLSRFGTLTGPFMRQKNRLTFSRQVMKGLNIEVGAKHETQTPLYEFEYFSNEDRTRTSSAYDVAEVTVSARYGKKEVFLVNDNERISLGSLGSPLFTFRFDMGSRSLGSDFSYQRIQAGIQQRAKLGLFGVSKLTLNGGYQFGQTPYSLLFNPIGNETPFYSEIAYNLMDFFEFSADRYTELRIQHSFEGFLLNRVPVIKKLKWRAIMSANAIWGGIKDSNLELNVFDTDAEGNILLPFREWKSAPYVEVGYGISSIFRIFSVQAFHRLTYRNNSDNFGVKFTVVLRL